MQRVEVSFSESFKRYSKHILSLCEFIYTFVMSCEMGVYQRMGAKLIPENGPARRINPQIDKELR